MNRKTNKILSAIVLVVCCMTFSVTHAQSYKNGTWYSLYDESEHELNTISNHSTGDIFAPTAQKLQFQWTYKKVDLFGWFPSNNTKIYESSNGGSNTSQVSTMTDETWDTEHSENINISANINWLKWDRPTGNTHKVTIYNLKVALAQHILLADGTYGAASKSYDFGEIDALSTSEAYRVSLRSFLSAGDITISSSDPEIFRVGSPDNTEALTYAVGANACASANGTAEAASGATLGKIDNYAFDIYFIPKEGKTYNGTITLTDGVSTATVSVSGVGRKLPQTITWEPATPVLSNVTITPAEASSGLEVSYTFTPEGILSAENGVLTIVGEGVVTATASQQGNTVYEAAEPVVRTLTIFPAVSRSEYSAAICEGESYSDEHFDGLTMANLYYDTIPNAYGGDSIICLALTVNPVYHFVESSEIHEGDDLTWQGINLSVLPTGDTALIVRYDASTGCDSVYTMHLQVLPPITYGTYQASFCEGDSLEFGGLWYKTATVDSVLVSEKNIYGGDSIVVFTAVVLPTYLLPEDSTINMDSNLLWREKEYGLFAPGTYTLYDSLKSQSNCDSVYVLTLTVNAIPYLIQETAGACQYEEGLWHGQPLPTDEAGTFMLYDSLKSIYDMDSVYVLTLTVHPIYAIEDEERTIHAGDADNWREIDLSQLPIGDTILTKVYTTVSGCDSVYTMHLQVLPPTTYGKDTIYICSRGETVYYDNVPYTKPSKTPFTVTLSTPNRFGGDSIVELWVLASNKYDMSFSRTIYQGTEEEWQGFDLSVLPLGDTTLIASYATVHGCDSTYTLHLSVLLRPTTYGTATLDLCEGSSVEYEGTIYDSPVNDTVLLAQKNQWGGDSIVYLTVNVWQPSYQETELSIYEGDAVVWQNIDLSLLPAGDTTLVASYATVHGCDSTYTLHLSVLLRLTTYGTATLDLCEGSSAEYEGTIYDSPVNDTVLLAQKNQWGGDSIVYLTVNVWQPSYQETELSIYEGDAVVWQNIDLSVLPAGDTTLIASYVSVHGCDSTFTLYLTVTESFKEGIDNQEATVGNDLHKVFINGVLFIRKGDDTYDLYGRKIK